MSDQDSSSSDVALTARQLVEQWRKKAKMSREEAHRMRRTLCVGTDAEERCWVRSELLDICADELAALLVPVPQRSENKEDQSRVDGQSGLTAALPQPATGDK